MSQFGARDAHLSRSTRYTLFFFVFPVLFCLWTWYLMLKLVDNTFMDYESIIDLSHSRSSAASNRKYKKIKLILNSYNSHRTQNQYSYILKLSERLQILDRVLLIPRYRLLYIVWYLLDMSLPSVTSCPFGPVHFVLNTNQYRELVWEKCVDYAIMMRCTWASWLEWTVLGDLVFRVLKWML